MSATNSPPDPDTLSLDELVAAAYPESCCTDVTDTQATFTLPRDRAVTVERNLIDEPRPADPRTGLAFHRYDMVESDGAVVRGYFDDTTVAVRFDCGGDRYQLTTHAAQAGLSDPGGLLALFAPRLSDAAGCPRTTVGSPTECLGLEDDLAACTETDSGNYPMATNP
ncbi:MAG: hypothetical protein KDA98_03710 [Acidimicrobiales bacterium]|nr:hypothetical protein [Acidimicrobiales bacterium]